MRDWISEMRQHTSLIQGYIDGGKYDSAWKSIGKYQEWCYERISIEGHDLAYAGTLLSSAETFYIRVLKKEKRDKEALIHTIYQCVIDSRDLKSHRKSVESAFRRCKFAETNQSEAVNLYKNLKKQGFRGAQQFVEIRGVVEGWT